MGSGSQVSQVSRGRIPGSENAFSMVKMFLFTWIFQKYSFRHIRANAQKREKETQNLHDLYRLHDLYHGECLVLLDTGTKAEPKQLCLELVPTACLEFATGIYNSCASHQ